MEHPTTHAASAQGDGGGERRVGSPPERGLEGHGCGPQHPASLGAYSAILVALYRITVVIVDVLIVLGFVEYWLWVPCYKAVDCRENVVCKDD